MVKFVLDRVENGVEKKRKLWYSKGENAGYQHFLLFP